MLDEPVANMKLASEDPDVVEKKSMGGELGFGLLVRPHHSL